MTGQPGVLQVVILRDGLLVGTEVFVPGQYAVGSGDMADLRLDDPSVMPSHATLHYMNGRAAIEDAGSQALFVNGHKVNACEVRPVDEINIGPFSLKVRVMAQKSPAPRPSAGDVASLLSRPASSPHLQPVTSKPVPSTVVSTRRSGNEPAVVALPGLAGPGTSQPEETMAFEDDPGATASFAVPEPSERGTVTEMLPQRPVAKPAPVAAPVAMRPPPPPAASVPPPQRAAPAPAPVQNRPAPVAAKPAAPTTQPMPNRAPAANKAPPPSRQEATVPAARNRKLPLLRTVPASNEGKGAPRLFLESYWGPVRKVARSFKALPKKQLLAGEDDLVDYPLWGFNLQANMVLAEQAGAGAYRIFVPQGATVERRGQDGKFHPTAIESLDVGADKRRSVTLSPGSAVRFSGEGEVGLVAYVQAPIPKPFANPLKGMPWLVLVFLAIFGSAFMSFVIFFTEARDDADFQGKNMSPVAVRLITPPKPEEKKKIEEKIKETIKKPEPKKEPVVAKVEKALPKPVPQETKQALKSIEKLTAAGPAMKDLLAAVDKLGGGPGKKDAKNDFKLSGLLGKQPIANAGMGSFGIGGGGAGGMGIKGAELLRGKGGAGIGALGAGNIGKGAVGGSVGHASARAMGTQGTIDKDAVAKVINSHLHEVSSCYERALLKEAGLAGKIVLEWQITTSGTVGYAKTKSSTMKSAAVESCILIALKGWKFPQAKGTGVVITYPFMFNSVGY